MARQNLDHQLCFAVYSAALAFNRAYKSFLDSIGLTYPQYVVMLALWSKDGQTVGNLCDSVFLETSTLTPLLKRLEKQGLLSRIRDAKDERQVRIWLTAAGRKLAQAAREIPECMLKSSGLSLPTAMRMKREISRLRDNLLKSGRPAA